MESNQREGTVRFIVSPGLRNKERGDMWFEQKVKELCKKYGVGEPTFHGSFMASIDVLPQKVEDTRDTLHELNLRRENSEAAF